jgi:hypothetical protein
MKKTSWKSILKEIKLDRESLDDGNYKLCVNIFYTLHNEIPCNILFRMSRSSTSKAHASFCRNFNLDKSRVIQNEGYESGRLVIEESILLIDKDLIVYIDGRLKLDLNVFYRPSTSKVKLKKVSNLALALKESQQKRCTHLAIERCNCISEPEPSFPKMSINEFLHGDDLDLS